MAHDLATADEGDGAPAAFRQQVASRFAVRLHVVLILSACFAVGLAVTKLLLMAGVSVLWLRYAVALATAYLAFLLGVRLWLACTGYSRRMLPSPRSTLAGDVGLPDLGMGGGSGSRVGWPGFRGGGGGSGGAGASSAFGGPPSAAPPPASTQALVFSSSPSSASSGTSTGGGSGGGGFDLGDGWVLVLLVGLVLALAGGMAWIVYTAPTILADAAFAGMLSAGLVRSTRHIASGGWVASVVGHTWLAFAIVFVLAMAFAVLAQRHFPEARTLLDVVRAL